MAPNGETYHSSSCSHGALSPCLGGASTERGGYNSVAGDAVAFPPRSNSSTSIIDLRNLLAKRFPHSPLPPTAHLRTGLPRFDEITGGGLRKSAITEFITPQWSAGSGLLIHALVHAACRDRYFIALIDGRDSFDPQPLGNSRLRHLLWVRCRKTMEAVKAADLLLRDGNFPLVILDLVLNAAEELRKIPQTTWYRLQRLVEPVPTALLVLTRDRIVSSTQRKLVLENSWTLEDLGNTDTISRLQLRIQWVEEGQTIAGAS